MGLDANKDVIYLDVGQGNQLAALLGGGYRCRVFSVSNNAMLALDKGMREMFFMGNEVKNSWGTLGDDGQADQREPQDGRRLSSGRRSRRCAICATDKEGTIAAMLKFSNVSRQQATRVYDDIIGTFTQNGARRRGNAEERPQHHPPGHQYQRSRCLTPGRMTSASRWRPTSS